ncbi:MAG TPA: ABC transporter permease subunit [Anaerolineae bacterium]|nr:ABC transporter permease subunit [Anaerolineae bacterium]
MSSGNSVMQLETGTGWSRGLNNLLRSELGRWFGTKQWWIQILIWTSIAVGIPLMAALATRDEEAVPMAMLFNAMLGIGGPIGVCILMQEALVGEKRSGTAAWVLSKPISRLAFLSGKLVANVLGIVVTMVVVPGLLLYLASALVMHTTLSPFAVLAGLGAHLVHLLFYVGLTLMLGSISDQGGAVIGLPLAFLFGQQFLPNLHRGLAKAIPFALTGGAEPNVTTALMYGMDPAAGYLPLVTTGLAAVLFLAIAIWVFQRQDL